MIQSLGDCGAFLDSFLIFCSRQAPPGGRGKQYSWHPLSEALTKNKMLAHALLYATYEETETQT